MNEIKTFRAASMQEALSLVRRELGLDAVVLNTRQVRHRRFLPFLKPREEVEITAGVGPTKRPAETKSVVTQVAASPFRQPSASVAAAAVTPVADPEPLTGISKAAKLAAELERRQAEKQKLENSLQAIESMTGIASSRVTSQSTDQTDAARNKTAPKREPSTSRNSESHSSQNRQPNSHKRFEDADLAVSNVAVEGKKREAATAPAATHPTDQATHLLAAMSAVHAPETAAMPASVNELSSKLDALQKMVESLTRTSQLRSNDEVPPELFEIYTGLIDADIEDDLARELVFRLRQDCSVEQLHDPIVSRAALTAMIEAEIRSANPIRPTNGRRRVVALVGPTGVGKTTTIAKLAANFRLRDGIKMGLVTVDTYRIAAVEQLRTYAEIIDLPMKVVTTPQDMRRALDELSGLDLVLIDTAGRSPRDELKIQELKQMLGEGNIDEVHLVMSLTASPRSIRMTAEQFAPVNPTAIVLTKLDEAAGMGCLLSVARQVKLPISYLTTGQDVPDDIEPAHPSRVARLVLGQDRLYA